MIARIVSSLVRMVLGPLSLPGIWRKLGALVMTLLLTVLTQVGGLILWPWWGVVWARLEDERGAVRRAKRSLAMLGIYMTGAFVIVPFVAEQTGRRPLPVVATDALPLGPRHLMYPLLMRNYVRHHAHDALITAVHTATSRESDMVVRYLDTGFPFPFIPLLPHLSHIDGQRIDLALQFSADGAYVDRARTPIGYWGYAQESREREACEGVTSRFGVPLRWNFAWLQPLLPDLKLDVAKNKRLFRALADDPRVCSILLEPTLHGLLASPKLAANGCGVARHDDHVHVTIRKACR